MKKHNFSAGPAILPQVVFDQAAAAIKDFNNSGLSLLEVSHRGKDFVAVLEESERLVRELYDIDDSYAVLFLTGGASSQFYMVPMNLLNENEEAGYYNTGTWATKAIKEAKNFGKVNVLDSSEEKGFNYLPEVSAISDSLKYLHVTSNNTIYGTQYHEFPTSPVPLVVDMSSDIFSRPLGFFKQAGIIYAGAQKNLGPAGTTLVIVKKDLLGKVNRTIPTMLNYETHIKKSSSFNTPPVFPIYVSMLNMRWIKNQGGVRVMEERNKFKAQTIYSELDSNPMFRPYSATKDRSQMNVTFTMANPELEENFVSLCTENDIVGIKGHRSVGGFRASIYNAMPMESVEHLVSIMKNFSEKYG